VQELVELDTGSSLKVTVARWLTPNGVSISEGGLTPDVVISRTPAERIAGEDPQLEAATRFLNGEDVVSETLLDQLAEGSTTTPETIDGE
jgi:carboxyl-terminal processing protease